MKIRVYYEDTDIGGIVYHTRYINFCERARSEVLFKNGLLPFDKDTNSGYVVRDLKCKFLKMATLGDILEVKSRVLSKSRVSFTLEQNIYKENDLIFNMQVTIVYIRNSKPSKIDERLVELFNE